MQRWTTLWCPGSHGLHLIKTFLMGLALSIRLCGLLSPSRATQPFPMRSVPYQRSYTDLQRLVLSLYSISICSALYLASFWVLPPWHREWQFWLIVKAMIVITQYKGCKYRMPPVTRVENSLLISCHYPDFPVLTCQHFVFAAFGVSFLFFWLPFCWQQWWFQCYFKRWLSGTQFKSFTSLWNLKILNWLSTNT